MNLKDQRLASALQELAAQYFRDEANRDSMMTVTRAEVENRGKNATIFFTVLPDSESEKALAFAKRRQNDFRMFMTSKKVVAFAPKIRFEIDYGEKNRQRIDELSQEIENSDNLRD